MVHAKPLHKLKKTFFPKSTAAEAQFTWNRRSCRLWGTQTHEDTRLLWCSPTHPELEWQILDTLKGTVLLSGGRCWNAEASAYLPPWQPRRLLTSRWSRPSRRDLSSGEKTSGSSTFWGWKEGDTPSKTHLWQQCRNPRPDLKAISSIRIVLKKTADTSQANIDSIKKPRVAAHHFQSPSAGWSQKNWVSSLFCIPVILTFFFFSFGLDFSVSFSYCLLANLVVCLGIYFHYFKKAFSYTSCNRMR